MQDGNRGKTTSNIGFSRLFEKIASIYPDKIAVICNHRQLTFNELNSAANQVAYNLIKQYKSIVKHPLQANDIILLVFERDIDFIIALLGVLKTGAAFLPVALNAPKQRLDFIIQQAECKLALTSNQYENSAFLADCQVEYIENLQKNDGEQSNLNVSPDITIPIDSLAYVIYTSGSTGEPKGVMIEHQNLNHYINAISDILKLKPGGKFANLSPVYADLGYTNIFLALCSANTLVLITEEQTYNPMLFAQTMDAHSIDVVKIVPSHLNVLLDCENPQAILPNKQLILGGEVASPQLLMKLHNLSPKLKIINHYGPTETTIGAFTFTKGNKYLESLPIGKVLNGMQAYVLDEERKPVKSGEIGELYLSGDGVARGYLKNPEETKKSFIDSVFLKGSTRAYKTGDLVRVLSDNNVEYIGRQDYQLKVRGYRVELTEIEHALNLHPDIKNAVVLGAKRNDKTVLVAYVILTNKKTLLDLQQIKEYLKDILPQYMIPGSIIFLEKLPLNNNGKLDRKKLLEKFKTHKAEVQGHTETDIEIQILKIYKEVLGLDNISVNDDFFELGGDSISAIQIISRAGRLGYSLQIQFVFDNPSVFKLAKFIESTNANKNLVIHNSCEEGDIPLSPIQQHFFSLKLLNQNHYNQAFLLETKVKLKKPEVEKIICALIEQHSTFRIRFRFDDGNILQTYQNNTNIFNVSVHEHLIAAENEELRKQKTDKIVCQLNKQLDISNGDILQVGLLHDDIKKEYFLYITIHHLYVDIISWHVLFADFAFLYELQCDNKALSFPAKTQSFLDWQDALLKFCSSKLQENEINYWQAVEKDFPQEHAQKNNASNNEDTGTYTFTLSKKLSTMLLKDANKLINTNINDILLSALVAAYSTWQKTEKIGLCLEGHGREDCIQDIDVSSVVGWFTSMYPVILTNPCSLIESETDYFSLIKHIKNILHYIPDNGLSYGMYRYLQQNNDNASFEPEFNICFNYIGQLDSVIKTSSLYKKISPLDNFRVAPQNRAIHSLYFLSWVIDDKFSLQINASTKQYSIDEINNLLSLLEFHLENIINACCNTSQRYYTPSDFLLKRDFPQKTLDHIFEKNQVENISYLSPIQEGMLFHYLYGPISDEYCVQISWELEASCKPHLFKQAWQEIIQRYPVFRLSFLWENLPEPIQIVHKNTTIPWVVLDWRQRAKKNLNRALSKLCKNDREKGFMLSEPCIMRFFLVRLEDEKYVFIWNHHHITMDGWSVSIIKKEVMSAYHAYCNNEKYTNLKLTSYDNYLRWLHTSNMDRVMAFWKSEVEGLNSPMQLPFISYKEGISHSQRVKVIKDKSMKLSVNVLQKAVKFKADYKITLNTLLQMTLMTLFSRYTNTDDIIFGMVCSGRPPEVLESDKIVGLLVNTLPLRMTLDNDKNIIDLLSALQQKIHSVNSNAAIGITDIKKLSNISDERLLFDCFSNYEHYPDYIQSTDFANYKINEKNSFTLGFNFTKNNGIFVQIQYDANRIKSEAIGILLKQFKRTFTNLLANPQVPLANLDILTAKERRQILTEWNDTSVSYPRDKTIVELFTEQVAQTPQNIAVSYRDEMLTYAELQQQVMLKANALHYTYHKHYKEGISKDSIIGVCMERNLDLVVTLLSIMQVNAAYMPIDPDFPISRIAYMLKDSQPVLILCQEKFASQLFSIDELPCPVLISEKLSEVAAEPIDNLDPFSAEQLAYVIYTSGSTGNPKGVMLQHRGIVNELLWMQRAYNFTSDDRVLQTTVFSFDISVWELFLPLVTGAELVIAEPKGHKDPHYLMELINRKRITTLQFVPTMLDAFVKNFLRDNASMKLTSLSRVFVIGEALSSELAMLFTQCFDAALYNFYGPTEASIGVSIYNCRQERSDELPIVPIGRPIFNTQLYVLDKNLNLLPVAMVGELYIGGEGLARGYLNRAKLTSERFIANPFVSTEDKLAGRNLLLYKTGDLCRWLPDGNIEYVGRMDFQVKVRGYRIELGEIEAKLQQHEDVSQAVVILSENNQVACLVAYVVLNKKSINKEMAISMKLQTWLSKCLPEYMVPSVIIRLDSLPLTSNDKLDRKALPAPEWDTFRARSIYTAPRDEMEVNLINLWQEVLNVKQVGIHDDFFKLGGHSILAMQLSLKIQQYFHVDCPVAILFKYKTVADLSSHIKSGINKNSVKDNIINITKAEKSDSYLLSSAQQRLWFLDAYESSSSATYNVPYIVHLHGKINVSILKQSFVLLLQRHQILRTYFGFKDDATYQCVDEKCDVFFEEIHTDEKNAIALTRTAIHSPFDLANGPVFKVYLYFLANNEFILLINQHHIITDRWSLQIITNELSEYYSALLEERMPELPEQKYQYIDYATWEQSNSISKRFSEQISYWQEQLLDAPTLTLPLDYVRPAVKKYDGANCFFELDSELVKSVRSLCDEADSTLFMVLFAVFNLLLHKYSGQDDIVVGTPIANRHQDGVATMLGFFINTLAIRSNITENISTIDYIKTIKATCLSAYGHQDIAFEHLVDTLNIERDTSRTPLFQVMFVLEQADELSTLVLPGVEVQDYSQGLEVAKFDLTLSVTEKNNRIGCRFNYDKALFSNVTISQMSGHFTSLLQDVVTRKTDNIASLTMLTSIEREQLLYGWNQTNSDYPKSKNITELFAEQVKRNPNNIAVVYQNKSLTYAELDKQANQMANYLRTSYQDRVKVAIQPDTFIALCMERSIDLIISILAILKVGAAYVPLDLNYPEARLAHMLNDTKAELLITNEKTFNVLALLHELKNEIIIIEQVMPDILACPESAPPNIAKPSSLAYISYTSGSTGLPKGVMIEHESVIALAKEEHLIDMQEGDVYAFAANISSDVAAFELWIGFLNGATMVCIDKQDLLHPERFKNIITQHNMTHIVMTTALFHEYVLFDSTIFSSLKYIMFGGEAVNTAIVDKLLQIPENNKVQVLNLYGPSENTTLSTGFNISRDKHEGLSHYPIGKPSSNTTAYILDRDKSPVPIGITGELYLGGIGVARGYLNREELTQERFINNPFLTAEELEDGRNLRLYRTGDLVRRLADGNIDYIGRSDFQIKIRGFRVELGEIEAELQSHDSVSQAVVLLSKVGDASHLVAYVVYNNEVEMLDTDELLVWLAERLPEHMIPTVIIKMQSLPLTANGKVDHKALPEINKGKLSKAKYTAPRNKTEQTLTELWQNILTVEKIGVYDDFFRLGGHSLLAIQLSLKIQKNFNIDCPVAILFSHKTIAELSGYIQDHQSVSQEQHETTTLTKAKKASSYPLSSAQQRLWFLDAYESSSSSTYNVPYVIRLLGELDAAVLKKSFDYLLARHDILRTHYGMEKSVPRQFVKAKVDIEFVEKDVKNNSLDAILHKDIHQSFDLSSGPIIKVYLYLLSDKNYVLLINHHHIATDGWSLQILLQELGETYQSYIKNQSPTLPELQYQYTDYAVWEQSSLASEQRLKQVDYWRTQLANMPILNLPTDYPRPAIKKTEGESYNFELDENIVEAVKLLCSETDSTLFMVMLAAFNMLLQRYSGQSDIIVGTPITSRKQESVASMLGFFINSLAIRSDLSGDINFIELVKRVKSTCLAAYSHQDVAFEHLVDELEVVRDTRRTPLFQVRFVLQQQDEQLELLLPDIEVEEYPQRLKVSKFDLTLDIIDKEDKLACSINYDKALFCESTIANMAGHFAMLLQEALASPKQPILCHKILSPGEYDLILNDWSLVDSQPIKDVSLLASLKSHTQTCPDAVAVVDAVSQLTYAELDKRSDLLAKYLMSRHRALGIDKDSEVFVGILLERSVAFLVAMLAVWKSGAAYIPFDLKFPAQRVINILNSAHAQFLIAEPASLPEICEHTKVEYISILEIAKHQDSSYKELTLPSVQSDKLAYIVYTSGSTGKPKGVMIEHKNVTNYAHALQRRLEFSSETSFVHISTLAADLGYTTLFMSLMSAGTLHFLTDEYSLDGQAFSTYMRTHNIDCLKITPSHLEGLLSIDDGPTLLPKKVLILGGESSSPCLLKKIQALSPQLRIINHYGPTEATIGAITHELKRDDNQKYSLPLGKGLANVSLYILDKMQQPVPEGVIGELYIGGAGVARGYLNNKSLTEQSFIPNPFSTNTQAVRLYKTGDLCKWSDAGDVIYIGRVDFQVKVRGYRIELNEIKVTLSQHDAVKNAEVLTSNKNQNQLIAYIVLANTQQPVTSKELRRYLHDRLPEYMVPSKVAILEQFPLTANGKINRQALSAIEINADEIGTGETSQYDEIEEIVLTIWCKVLDINKVAKGVGFFCIGGNSLLAMTLCSLIQEHFSIRFPVNLVFKYSSVDEMASYIRNNLFDVSGYKFKMCVIKDRKNEYSLSTSQERIWFLSQYYGKNFSAYNMPHAYNLDGEVNIAVLEKSLDKILSRHESFNTVFIERGGQVRQKVVTNQCFKLDVIAVKKAQLPEHLKKDFYAPFDLINGPLIRLKLYNLSAKKHVLVISQHHLITDGWSVKIILNELKAIYSAYIINQEPELSPQKYHYKDFVFWQRRLLSENVFNSQIDYWQKKLKNFNIVTVPCDHKEVKQDNFLASQFSIMLNNKEKNKIHEIVSNHNVTPFMFFLSCVMSLLYACSGSDDVVVGSNVANRHYPDTGNIVGFFANSLPFRAQFNKDLLFSDLLSQVKETCLEAYANQDVPFEVLLERLKMSSGVSALPLYKVAIDYTLAATESEIDMPGFVLSPIKDDHLITKLELVFRFVEHREGLSMQLVYNNSLYNDGTIKTVFKALKDLMSSLFAGYSDKPIIEMPLFSQLKKHFQNKQKILLSSSAKQQLSFSSKVALSATKDKEFALKYKLSKIWYEILGHSNFSTKDPFYMVGANRILSIRILECINKMFNREYDLAWLFEHATINSQIHAFSAAEINTKFQPIIKYNDFGGKIPIYFVHPISSGAEVYAELAKTINEDIPFYGIDSDFVFQSSQCIKTIKALANRYLSCIRNTNHVESYCLGGWGFGGVIAFEMAQQLRKENQPVKKLLLVDSCLTTDYSLDIYQYSEKHIQQINTLWHLLPKTYKEHIKNNWKLAKDLLQNYKPEKYNGDTILIKASKETKQEASIKPIKRLKVDDDYGWKSLIDHLEIKTISATHDTILHGQALKEITDIINKL